ncbi:MAG: kynureninase [Rhizobiaceae bacterium]|nr:kynureninase [Rhizobiaceae bacterium]
MTNFTKTKSLFHLPKDIIYLDGNSLGPLPVTAESRVSHMIREEWGELLIKGWNEADWFIKPAQLGDRLAKMLGAPPASIILGDTLSIKIYQALASAIDLAADRKIILSDTGNFPTDLYMAQGLISTINQNHELTLVEHEEIEASLNENIAVLMLTHVDYRTGRMHDMQKITRLAQDLGIITIWDLAHSAGAVPVDLTAANVDFAAGCTYKYLNSGPGGPAFIYVAPRHVNNIKPALSGWLGHDAPFAFDLDYRPGPAIERMRVGTPPILQLAALEAALDIWDDIDMANVRAKSIELSEMFISLIEKNCPQLILASPREAAKRGSQVSFHFRDGYAAIRALIERGVIGDFRKPDIMRFAITPLYLNEDDIIKGAQIIADVVNSGIWKQDKYHQTNPVT